MNPDILLILEDERGVDTFSSFGLLGDSTHVSFRDPYTPFMVLAAPLWFRDTALGAGRWPGTWPIHVQRCKGRPPSFHSVSCFHRNLDFYTGI